MIAYSWLTFEYRDIILPFPCFIEDEVHVEMKEKYSDQGAGGSDALGSTSLALALGRLGYRHGLPGARAS